MIVAIRRDHDDRGKLVLLVEVTQDRQNADLVIALLWKFSRVNFIPVFGSSTTGGSN